MAPITKPLLAVNIEDVETLKYPVYATKKIDGIRSIRQGTMLSRTFKPIKNPVINELLSGLLPDGADGEIVIGNFQETTSAVMTGHMTYVDPFTYYWFDYVKDDPNKPYLDRVKDMQEYIDAHPEMLTHPQAKIVPLFPKEIDTVAELLRYQEDVLEGGFEGVMLRSGTGKYKTGRSTLKERILLKLKKFSDMEANVIGVNELMKNTNAKTKNAVGDNKRSSHIAGKIPMNTLGSLEVELCGVKFAIGTGFSAELRKHLWKKRESLIGQIVKFKYFEIGMKDAPRHPVFVGFRDADDM